MAYSKFKIGLPSSSSTPQTPVLSTTPSDYIQFDINPRSWEEDLQGGNMTTTLSGNPKVSTTRVGNKHVSLNFQKMSDSKKESLSNFINQNTTLVVVDDSGNTFEIVVVPGSFRCSRKRSTFFEQVSWEVNIQVVVLN